ncbi:MAG: 50S ribosomal protein L3 [Candidatus Altiarchaeales archaeon]|nr:50S ribosomal protein L3 [Candidatus Altiarchaeales archaeon]
MAKSHKPRSGSMAFYPRKRAKKEVPRIHSWVDTGEATLLGFTGYKVGMTHILAVDHRKNSPTSDLEIFLPATIIETPPLIVAGLRFYGKGYLGKKTITDIWAKDIPEDIEKKVKLPKKRDPEKKLEKIEENLDSISDIRAIINTQPRLTSLAKKVPDIMEIGVGGEIKDKFEFAKGILGSRIPVGDVLKENSFVDITAVTKGKGFQGVVKRFGVKIQPRKAGKGRRHIGSGGAWTPARKLFTEPLPGQMGYHTRSEYNKIILKIGGDGTGVNPKGGFLRYGNVKGEYVMLLGSVPGPAKRLIRMSYPRRASGEANFEIRYISTESKQ